MSPTSPMLTALVAGLLLGRYAFASPVRDVEIKARDAVPQFPYDSATTKYCNWWFDSPGDWSCADITEYLYIPQDDFLKWNPTVQAGCAVLPAERSFCIGADDAPEPTTTPKTSTTAKATSNTSKAATPATTTKKSSSTVKTSSTGIITPTPTQGGMVKNCNKFYSVKQGDNCEAIASAQKVPATEIAKWNDVGGAACTGLWADVYLCVSTPGYKAPTTTAKPPATSTKGNGVTTPTPFQPGMVTNCNKFYKVASGNTCATIVKDKGVTLANFLKWNPKIGGEKCDGLWKDNYVCIGVIGGTPTTSKKPTSTVKGVTTPTPTQSGLTKGCKKFYKSKKGDTCDSIAKANKITVANFIKWNAGVGAKCDKMWADTYHCVGV